MESVTTSPMCRMGKTGAHDTSSSRIMMSNVARLRTPGGALVMPARSPYEREIVFDNAAFYAARQGTTELELSSPRLSIRVVKVAADDRCATCRLTLRHVAFVVAGIKQCRNCMI